MSATKKILTVFGATGNQGRSVINHVLATPSLSSAYALRGITRDPSKESAKAISAQGVEMVAGDMNSPASLAEAIKGSHAVFAITNYWESKSASVEVTQGKAVADASIAAGVKLLIWSALPHVTTLTGGKLAHMDHFDSKADVATYIETAKKGTGLAAAYVEPGFFMSNIKGMVKPQNKVPTLTLPWHPTETQVPLFDVASDTGLFVGALLAQEPSAVDGKRVLEVSEWATPEQIMATLTKGAGQQTNFQSVPENVFEGFLPKEIAKELTENMVLIRDYSYYGVKGKESEVEGLNTKVVGKIQPTSWESFIAANKPWSWSE